MPDAAEARLRRLWLAVTAVAAAAAAVGAYVDVRRAPDAAPRYAWVSPAAIVLLGLAGLAGHGRRGLHAALLAASVALLGLALVLFLRGGTG